MDSGKYFALSFGTIVDDFFRKLATILSSVKTISTKVIVYYLNSNNSVKNLKNF